MKNEFLNALGTDKENINTDLSLYAKFVGDWTFVMNQYLYFLYLFLTHLKIRFSLICTSR